MQPMLDYIKPMFRWRWAVLRWMKQLWSRLRVPVARVWRPLMFRTRFIAICGSAGKTTTKEILAGILEKHVSLTKTSGTWGGMKFGGVPGTILQVRPWHRFAIVEAGIETAGQMRQMAKLIKPDVVVMLGVNEHHLREFGTLEAIAAEKAEMLKELSATGVAILNLDDPRVAAMVTIGPFEVIGFGLEGQQISAEKISSEWPRRLELTLTDGHREFLARTRLVGTHWVRSILAAVTTARHVGIEMDEIVPVVEAFEPFWGRMQPITLPDGVTYLRDEFNGTLNTYRQAFKILRDAAASRKIAVISDFSDSSEYRHEKKRFRYLAQELLDCVDLIIYVGDRSEHARRLAIKAGFNEASVYEAYDPLEASRILREIRQPGDLVLLKGRTSDHLSKVYLDQLATVSCTLQSCPRQYLCDRCNELGFVWEEKYAGLMAPPDVVV